jgi:hypothetical protein
LAKFFRLHHYYHHHDSIFLLQREEEEEEEAFLLRVMRSGRHLLRFLQKNQIKKSQELERKKRKWERRNWWGEPALPRAFFLFLFLTTAHNTELTTSYNKILFRISIETIAVSAATTTQPTLLELDLGWCWPFHRRNPPEP